MISTILVCLAFIVLMAAAVSGVCAAALDQVISRGRVNCGIPEESPGFSFKDASGTWKGFSVDFCRAVAAATLGDAEKVSFVPLTPSARFPVLLSGKVDLLAHTATVTLGREAGIGVHFAGIYFYDGQSFMVPGASRVRKVEDLSGANICVEKGTTHQATLEMVFRGKGLRYKPLVSDSLEAVKADFFSGKCQAVTGDRSRLAALQLSAPGGSKRFRVLPGSVSKEPLGPTVRSDDEKWLTLVRWVLFALIEAEERGITSKNVGALQKSSADPAVKFFLNSSGNQGKRIGLKPEWIATVIAQVGNYGEIYARNFGGQSRLKIDRGLNRPWTRGGLLYSPPFQ